ncbi:MAG: Phosphomethylpyrimidine kinase [Acidobacteriaceae bacterium]|nr:Phosphomethylpyrimidine kinase [Acidobacteriaceae bacterium]
MSQAPPIVLTIAGFDPSSGAGVTADIQTIAAHGCYGVSAITALTVQSTAGVREVVPVDPKLLAHTLEELQRDVKVSAVHIGMLGSSQVVSVVADFLKDARLKNAVLDPVFASSSGAALLDKAGIALMVQRLLPLADVITPNVDEAAALTGLEVKYPAQMKLAAKRLHEMGAKSVAVTGGHLGQAIDLLSVKGDQVQTYCADRVDSPNTHGTGCAFSTAIACQLALGQSLPMAVLLAKAYVLAAIKHSYSIGRGPGPVNHMWRKEGY